MTIISTSANSLAKRDLVVPEVVVDHGAIPTAAPGHIVEDLEVTQDQGGVGVEPGKLYEPWRWSCVVYIYEFPNFEFFITDDRDQGGDQDREIDRKNRAPDLSQLLL